MTIENCTFQNNDAVLGGGAIYVDDSGSDSLNIINCNFIGNESADSGGAIQTASSVTLNIDSTTFSGNTSNSIGGGAINIVSSGGTISNSIFYSNTANNGNGGAVYDYHGVAKYINCLFYLNSSDDQGGAIYLSDSNSNHIDYITASLNTAINGGGALYFDGTNSSTTYIFNNIVWGNTSNGIDDDIYEEATYDLHVYYSLFKIYNGSVHATCIQSDPQFADPVSYNFRLTLSSPAIDAGDGSQTPDTDIEGNARYDHPSAANTGWSEPWVDMGAYEYY